MSSLDPPKMEFGRIYRKRTIVYFLLNEIFFPLECIEAVLLLYARNLIDHYTSILTISIVMWMILCPGNFTRTTGPLVCKYPKVTVDSSSSSGSGSSHDGSTSHSDTDRCGGLGPIFEPNISGTQFGGTHLYKLYVRRM